MWQDYVIAATVLMFTLTAIPMVLRDIKLPPLTTTPMFLGSITLAFCYASLALWFSFGVELVAMWLWSILFRRSVR
jgi:hypothetical protein